MIEQCTEKVTWPNIPAPPIMVLKMIRVYLPYASQPNMCDMAKGFLENHRMTLQAGPPRPPLQVPSGWLTQIH